MLLDGPAAVCIHREMAPGIPELEGAPACGIAVSEFGPFGISPRECSPTFWGDCRLPEENFEEKLETTC